MASGITGGSHEGGMPFDLANEYSERPESQPEGSEWVDLSSNPGNEQPELPSGNAQEISVLSNPDNEGTEMQTVAFFGKTGDGKSTLCNMLLFSDPDGAFETGANVGSVSQQVASRSNGSWTVIDTIGLGDALKDSRTDSRDALSKLKKFFATEPVAVDHFCYVMRKGEFTKYEKMYWECFQQIFGKYKEHIRLIFTSASERWLHDNGDAIKELIYDCPMIAVDFPPKVDDIHQEELLRKKREKNLTRLRDFLSDTKISTGEPVPIGKKTSRHLMLQWM